jgi:hypothetical protein
VDTAKIGAGIYDIICQKGEEAIVAFGMIPKWAMDACERMLREKIIAEAAKQSHCTPEELKPFVDEALVTDMVNKIMHEIAVGIYAEASNQGRMVV